MDTEINFQEVAVKCIDAHVLNFKNITPDNPSTFYKEYLEIVLTPLYERVMKEARGNQSKAALMLGINRNTLRKKLLELGLINKTY